MKWERWEFWVCLMFAAALILVGVQLAHAATPQQLIHDTVGTETAGPVQYVNTLNTITTSTAITGTMTKLHLWAKISGNAYAWITWWDGWEGSCVGGEQHSVSPPPPYYQNEAPEAGVVKEYTWNITHTFDPNKCFRIAFDQTQKWYGSSDPSSWPYGYGLANNTYPADFSFQLEGASYTAPEAIAITSPVSTSTPIFDFSNWTISFNQTTSTTATSSDFYIKQIYVGATSTALTTLAGNTSLPPTILPSPALISKPFALDLGTWYAQAQLRYFRDIYDQYGTLAATSSVINFTITGFGGGTSGGYGASGGWTAPTSTATSSEWVMTCDPDSGAFAYSLCFLAQALFVPSSASTNQFQSIDALVKAKPPMGYFNLVKTAISGVSTTTTSTVTLPDLSALNTPFLTPIRTALQYILWFFFGFWVFHRIRHLQL